MCVFIDSNLNNGYEIHNLSFEIIAIILQLKLVNTKVHNELYLQEHDISGLLSGSDAVPSVPI